MKREVYSFISGLLLFSCLAISCDDGKIYDENNQTEREGGTVKTLREAKPGETVTVTKLNGTGAVKRRIMDMGITKGSELYIRKVAPLGDPVEITVRGYELSVRKNDAQCVQVK